MMLQSCSNQNSMELAQEQTHKTMEQNRESRNIPMFIWSINLQQSRQEYTDTIQWGKDILFNSVAKTG